MGLLYVSIYKKCMYGFAVVNDGFRKAALVGKVSKIELKNLKHWADSQNMLYNYSYKTDNMYCVLYVNSFVLCFVCHIVRSQDGG